MATDPNDIRLDGAMRKQLARLADETGRMWREVLNDALRRYFAAPSGGSQKTSLLSRATKAGFVGVIKDGPSDLSSNRRHFDKFGRD